MEIFKEIFNLLISFIKIICKNDWYPTDLFEVVDSTKYHEDGIFGYSSTKTHRTEFGEFLDNSPGVFSFIFLIIYYPISFIVVFLNTINRNITYYNKFIYKKMERF